METDVVIVGGGIAGFTAGLRAVELGLRATLLEKTTVDPSWCNSRVSSGAVHAAWISVKSPPEAILNKLTHDTSGTADPDLARAFAEGALPTVRWLQEEGVRFIKAGPHPWQGFILAPPPQNRAGLSWEGRGPDVTLRRFKEKFVKLGGVYRNGHRVGELLAEGGRVVGAAARTEGGSTVAWRSRAVVLADGGFQANRDMVNRYIAPKAFDRIKLRATNTGTGDGIRMAEALGARLVQMGGFYGHLQSLDVLHNEKLWPYPSIDFTANAALLVWRRTGRRFVDEGLNGIHLANLIAKAEDPQDAVVILDHALWEGPAAERIIPPNPNLTLNDGTLHTAGTLDELAACAGIEPGTLRQTVEEYNRAVAEGARGLAVPRTGRPRPIARPPFHAIPVVPGITCTMGGVLINRHGQVMNTEGEPIGGLWAAGTTAGGLEGGPQAGYAGGLLQAALFAKRVAESIARPPSLTGRVGVNIT